jgi:hypothetical protein
MIHVTHEIAAPIRSTANPGDIQRQRSSGRSEKTTSGAMPGRREPTWSDAITTPLAGLIPAGRRDVVLSAIKVIHTAIFASVAGAILIALWDGLRARPRRRTAIAGGMVVAETAIFLSNNQVCPLTPLASELGAERGSVVDIFLPDWAASRIPVVAGTAALLALLLNLHAWRRSRHRTGATA